MGNRRGCFLDESPRLSSCITSVVVNVICEMGVGSSGQVRATGI